MAQYILLFLEGMITFISPCLLPMLPIYISFFSGGEVNKRKTLVNALGFSLGFTLVFVALGAFAGTIGRWLQSHLMVVNIVTGIIVILFGLNYLGIIKIPLLNKVRQREQEEVSLTFPSAVLFGVVFSVGWTPCVGAFLGSALMRATIQGSVLGGMGMLLTYSLGLSLPFIASAVLMDRLKGTFDFIKRNYRTIQIVSGCLLIAVGILMATGLMGQYMRMVTNVIQ